METPFFEHENVCTHAELKLRSYLPKCDSMMNEQSLIEAKKTPLDERDDIYILDPLATHGNPIYEILAINEENAFQQISDTDEILYRGLEGVFDAYHRKNKKLHALLLQAFVNWKIEFNTTDFAEEVSKSRDAFVNAVVEIGNPLLLPAAQSLDKFIQLQKDAYSNFESWYAGFFGVESNESLKELELIRLILMDRKQFNGSTLVTEDLAKMIFFNQEGRTKDVSSFNFYDKLINAINNDTIGSFCSNNRTKYSNMTSCANCKRIIDSSQEIQASQQNSYVNRLKCEKPCLLIEKNCKRNCCDFVKAKKGTSICTCEAILCLKCGLEGFVGSNGSNPTYCPMCNGCYCLEDLRYCAIKKPVTPSEPNQKKRRQLAISDELVCSDDEGDGVDHRTENLLNFSLKKKKQEASPDE
jgi:hypothetical protein